MTIMLQTRQATTICICDKSDGYPLLLAPPLHSAFLALAFCQIYLRHPRTRSLLFIESTCDFRFYSTAVIRRKNQFAFLQFRLEFCANLVHLFFLSKFLQFEFPHLLFISLLITRVILTFSSSFFSFYLFINSYSLNSLEWNRTLNNEASLEKEGLFFSIF